MGLAIHEFQENRDDQLLHHVHQLLVVDCHRFSVPANLLLIISLTPALLSYARVLCCEGDHASRTI